MKIIEAFKPTFYHPLCDGDTQIDSSKKRTTKSVDRTEEFIDTCIEYHRKSESLKDSFIIGPIEGGYDKIARSNSIKILGKYDEINGYLIDGLHCNGPNVASIDRQSVTDIVNHCINELPNEKLRMMLGAYNPLMVLEMASLGVDIFDSTFPCLQAKNNAALTFNFDLLNENDTSFQLNLSDEK